MAREAGKGSGRRRSDVPDEVVSSNWELAFGQKNNGETTSMTDQQAPAKPVEEVFDPYLTINS